MRLPAALMQTSTLVTQTARSFSPCLPSSSSKQLLRFTAHLPWGAFLLQGNKLVLEFKRELVEVTPWLVGLTKGDPAASPWAFGSLTVGKEAGTEETPLFWDAVALVASSSLRLTAWQEVWGRRINLEPWFEDLVHRGREYMAAGTLQSCSMGICSHIRGSGGSEGRQEEELDWKPSKLTSRNQ